MENKQLQIQGGFTVRKVSDGKSRITASDDVINAMVISYTCGGLNNIAGLFTQVVEELRSLKGENKEVLERVGFLESVISRNHAQPKLLPVTIKTSKSKATSPEEELANTYVGLSKDELREQLVRLMRKVSKNNGRRKIGYPDYRPVYKRFYELTGICVEKQEKQLFCSERDSYYYYGECWPNTLFNMGHGALLTAIAEMQSQTQ